MGEITGEITVMDMMKAYLDQEGFKWDLRMYDDPDLILVYIPWRDRGNRIFYMCRDVDFPGVVRVSRTINGKGYSICFGDPVDLRDRFIEIGLIPLPAV